MIKAIVYKSNTGHTMEYAKMLSKKLNIPYFTINEAKNNLKNKEEIVYLGWVCATKISGLGKVRKKYDIKCCIAVGLYPEDKNYIKNIKDSNKLEDTLFYLRGGLDYTKLKGIKKKLLLMVSNEMEKENKPENKELIEILKNGANFVAEENLEKVLKYINNE